LEEAFWVRESSIRTWLCRSGKDSQRLHERICSGLNLLQVKLDELWANVRYSGQCIWVWVASDATTRLVPVLQVGVCTYEMAYEAVYDLKR